MALFTIEFALTGKHALLMHHDNLDGAAEVEAWQDNPDNADFSKKGDDRTPPWVWVTYLYQDADKNIAIPTANLAKCLCLAGARIPLPGGRKNKTLKEVSQNGLTPLAEHISFFNAGKIISAVPFLELRQQSLLDNRIKFKAYLDLAAKHGFKLFSKRAKVGQSKHVRVRPRFDEWSATGRYDVEAEVLTLPLLQQLFDIAGTLGIGDWRPSSPRSPGPFGRFQAKVKIVK